MMPGCLARIIPVAVVLAIVLWFLQSPESVAGLITAGLNLIGSGADSFGRFMNALIPSIEGLF